MGLGRCKLMKAQQSNEERPGAEEPARAANGPGERDVTKSTPAKRCRLAPPAWRTCLVLPGLLLFPLLAAGGDAGRPPEPLQAVVVDVQGGVEVRGAGGAAWQPVRRWQLLQPNDRVQTRTNSFVAVRFGDRAPVRFGELSDFTFQPPATNREPARLNLWRGLLYFFGRDTPARLRMESPLCATAIRGTEFALEVQENGRTILTLVDGEAEVSAGPLGSEIVKSGQQAVTEPGRKPVVTVGIAAINVIQWFLYYPAVLDPDELRLSSPEREALSDSLAAYRAGDLRQALARYPEDRHPASDSEKVYLAAILLAAGEVEKSEQQLAALPPPEALPPGAGVNGRLAAALRQMVASVKNQPWVRPRPPELATEWLAESYWLQAQHAGTNSLPAALQAARAAVAKSTNFAFGWVRVAELEFSFGRNKAALAALEKSLPLASRNAQALALKGFLLAGRNHIKEAIEVFNEAIALDGRLANGWLGRGLCRIHQGKSGEGRVDLLTAAAMEPQRSVLRSYLGKASSDAWDDRQARHELELARSLDANDPTSWLYSALNNQQHNRVNEAIRDLETSQALNDNRSLYRSEFLLDQDRAVRSANLARVYQDAGLNEVAFREAVRAVNADYANYSAHLFLANSYDRMRDPNLINLRYETPAYDEYLLANLLAPVGTGTLSPLISQQEYSKLFERNGLGVISSTEYLSRGAWTEAGAQYGTFGNSSYSIDAFYRTDPGQRPNNDVEQMQLSLSFKQQITPQDSVYLQVGLYNSKGGDLFQYYDPSSANPAFRYTERQEPFALAGYHHEWTPGAHTLFLAGYFNGTFEFTDPIETALVTAVFDGELSAVRPINMTQQYRNQVDIYSAELQQIWQTPNHNTIAGMRGQWGPFHMQNLQSNPSDLGGIFNEPAADQDFKVDFRRVSLYAYHQWQILRPFSLTVGLSYDWLSYPENFRFAPLSPEESTRDQLCPKVGLIWSPHKDTVVRAAYTRSLAGASLDQSLRLEPTQVAGFHQAFRSLIPESVASANAGALFDTFGVSLEQKFSTGTYLGLTGQLLKSSVGRTVGAFELNTDVSDLAYPAGLREDLNFEEWSLLFTVDQLLGKEWSVGARYRLTQAKLNDNFVEVPDSAFTFEPFQPRQNLEALLHQVDLHLVYNHPSGFFTQLQALWNFQSNEGYVPDRPSDDFWQLNAFLGYRFPRRQAELRVGVLNLTDQDYRLNPLTLYNELARTRTFVAQLKLSF